MSNSNNISSEQFDKIERFLQEQMTDEEIHAFEKEMENNEELKLQAKELQMLFLGIQEANLQNELKNFHKEIPAKQVVLKNESSFKLWFYAAAAFIIVALALWLLVSPNQNEKLYAAYYKPDPGLLTAMGTSDEYDFERAMVDYKTGKYEEALNAWKQQLTAKPENDTLNYFVASSYLALKNEKAAIEYFRKVSGNKNGYFLSDANWYLGLAFLKEGNKRDALFYIRQSEHSRKQELMSKLKDNQ